MTHEQAIAKLEADISVSRGQVETDEKVAFF